MTADDDLLPILDDERSDGSDVHESAWRILIVDDDEEVHASTRYALGGVRAVARPLALTHAHSAAEARALLRTDTDFAVILLDVVMETESAGLDMVEFIRNDMGMEEVRIILRTGQPGYAPEIGIFNSYDINDYRTKAELTRIRLITAITSALRSYQQIRTIAEHRRGLELIVSASSDLMERKAINAFAEGILTQLSALLRLPLDGIVCAQRGSPLSDDDPDSLYIIGACGQFAHAITRPIEAIGNPVIVNMIRSCMELRTHCFDGQRSGIYLNSAEQEGVVFVHTGEPLARTDQQLIEVFAANISACFGNVRLFERLNYVAYHDTLTSLPNRASFIRSLDNVLTGSSRVTVAVADLQHFGDVNNGLGHEIGNALLNAVARRLRGRLDSECEVARLGADVFGLIGPSEQINPERVFELFAAPFEVADNRIPVGITAGFCHVIGDEDSGLSLLKRANIALNRARQSTHSNYEYFAAAMEEDTRWRLELVGQLRDSFRARQLEVWYQPQIELSTGKVCGVEALLRWPDGRDGFVEAPSAFIPLAEYSGLILEMGEWVLDQACCAFMRMRETSPQLVRIAVNVSMSQFRNAGFARIVAALMRRHGVARGQLEVELTESLAMDEPKAVLGNMQALKQVGAAIAIDDFGTGYSSLAHLRELPIDCLKIDRAFVAEIDSGKGAMFAETIIAFAKKLGISVVAEGVETGTQDAFLRRLGCDTGQGFHYAQPMPLDRLLPWLAGLTR